MKLNVAKCKGNILKAVYFKNIFIDNNCYVTVSLITLMIILQMQRAPDLRIFIFNFFSIFSSSSEELSVYHV